MYLYKKNIQVMLESEDDIEELKIELNQLLKKYSAFGKYSEYNLLDNEVTIPCNNSGKDLLRHSSVTYKPGQIIEFYSSLPDLTYVTNPVTHICHPIKDGSKIIIIGIDTDEKRVLALVLSDYDFNRLINGNTTDEFLNHCFENYLLDIKYSKYGIDSINNYHKSIDKDEIAIRYFNYGKEIDKNLLLILFKKLSSQSKYL